MKTWNRELALGAGLCLPLIPALCQQHSIVSPQPVAIGGLIGRPLTKTQPEYSQEASVAELEGQVVLRGWIGDDGVARDLQVQKSLGLGLDEEAIEAVKQWQFKPPESRSPDKLASFISVEFLLPSKQSRWHLVGIQFDTPPGASRPAFVSALYPIGAGIGPEAIEEGRVLAAIGRVAAAKLSFEVDEHGLPMNFQVVNASEAVWGGEATALVGEWRFTPGTQNGIPIPVPCTVELLWGARELSEPAIEKWRLTLKPQ